MLRSGQDILASKPPLISVVLDVREQLRDKLHLVQYGAALVGLQKAVRMLNCRKWR